jgi:tetratricopeptide (TPR) repeat protein
MKKNLLTSFLFSVYLLFAVNTAAWSQQTIQDGLKYIDNEQFQNAKKLFQNLVKQDPSKPEHYYYLGNTYLLLFDIDSADEYIDTARMNFELGVTKDAKYALNYVGLGSIKMFQKNKQGAVDYFNKAMEMTRSKDVEVLYRIAQGYIMFDYNDPVSAIEVLTKAIERDKKRVDLYLMRGDAFLMQNDGSRANTDYDEAIRLQPTSPRGYIRSGKVLIRAKNFQGALDLYKTGIEKDPNYMPSYRELGELYYLAGRYKEAIDAYRKYINNSDAGLDAKYKFAAFLYLNKDYMEAIDILRELDKVLQLPVIHRLMGYCYYEVKQFDIAAEQMEEFFKESKPNKILPDDYAYRGRAYLAKNPGSAADTVKGIENIYLYAQKDTTKAEKTLTELAESFYKQKKYTKAAEVYEQLVKTVKNVNSNAYFKLGLSYYFVRNEFATALQANAAKIDKANIMADTTLSKLLVLVPNSTQANLWKARVKVRLEPASANLKDGATAKFLAKPYYEKYVELMEKQTDKSKSITDLVESCWFLGNYSLHSLKDKAKAEEWWKKGLSYNPNYEPLKNILQTSEQSKDIGELMKLIK